MVVKEKGGWGDEYNKKYILNKERNTIIVSETNFESLFHLLFGEKIL